MCGQPEDGLAVVTAEWWVLREKPLETWVGACLAREGAFQGKGTAYAKVQGYAAHGYVRHCWGAVRGGKGHLKYFIPLDIILRAAGSYGRLLSRGVTS